MIVKEFSEPVKEVIALFADINCKGKYTTRLQILDGLLDCIISIGYNLIINQHRFKMLWFENNKREEWEFSVQTEEDCLAAIGQLLKLQYPVNNPSILSEQNRYGMNKKYTHVIYITSEVREEDIIEWSDNHKDSFFTVFYINDLDKYPVNEKLKSVLHDFNIVLYEIDINNIESTIGAVGIA